MHKKIKKTYQLGRSSRSIPVAAALRRIWTDAGRGGASGRRGRRIWTDAGGGGAIWMGASQIWEELRPPRP